MIRDDRTYILSEGKRGLYWRLVSQYSFKDGSVWISDGTQILYDTTTVWFSAVEDLMASPAKIVLGVFAAGEIPFPLVHTFRDNNKLPIDISGWTVSAKAEGPDEDGTYGGGAVNITDGVNGEVTYTWVVEDFTGVGKYKMLLWVTDGTNDIASDLITWEVYDGPGTAGP